MSEKLLISFFSSSKKNNKISLFTIEIMMEECIHIDIYMCVYRLYIYIYLYLYN